MLSVLYINIASTLQGQNHADALRICRTLLLYVVHCSKTSLKLIPIMLILLPLQVKLRVFRMP
jgi:hypothetical protein